MSAIRVSVDMLLSRAYACAQCDCGTGRKQHARVWLGALMRQPLFVCLAATTVLSTGALTRTDSLFAQELPGVPVGTVVRVWTSPTGSKSHVGMVAEITPDTIVLALRRDQPSISVGRRDIHRLDARMESRPLAGALRGAGLGLLLGGVVGALYGNQVEEGFFRRHDLKLAYGAAGAGIGLVGGAFFGAVLGVDRWREVPLGASSSFISGQRSWVNVGVQFYF